MFKDHIKKETLHHAYCIHGRGEDVLPLLIEYCEKDLCVVRAGNSDFSVDVFESMGIQDGRALQQRQMRAGIGGGLKIFIVAFTTITSEAQNALLKVFEEPTANTHFFLVTPEPGLLLPTLRSRLVIVPASVSAGTGKGVPSLLAEAKKFLALSYGERMNFVKEIAEDKEKGYISDFLDAVEYVVRSGDISKHAGAMEEYLKMRSYLFDRASSVKMILEYIALVIPK